MEFFKTHKNLVTAVCAVASIAVAVVAGKDFYDFRHYQEVIIPGEGVTSTFQLSEYNENLKGTFGDTTVYVMQGEKEGGSFLVLGGTHPNEPSGHMAAITMIESGKVEAGTVYVIPRTDNSAFTHNDPQSTLPISIILRQRAVRASLYTDRVPPIRLTSGRIRTYIPTRRDRRFPEARCVISTALIRA